MTQTNIYNSIINYLNENKYDYSIYNTLNLIRIINSKDYITNITIKPISEIVDFHLINLKTMNVVYEISLGLNDDVNLFLNQIDFITMFVYNNIMCKSIDNTIKLELTIDLAPEETNFENIFFENIFFDPNYTTDNYSKSKFIENTLNINNLKLHSIDIGDNIGKITGVRIL